MTDKKSTPADSNTSDNVVDEKLEATAPEKPAKDNVSEPTKGAVEDKKASTNNTANHEKTEKTASSRRTATSKNKTPRQEAKGSNKLAGFALFLALIAIAGCAGIFYWYQQQLIVINQQASDANAKFEQDNQRQITALVTKQTNQLEEKIATAQQGGESELARVSQELTRLSNDVSALKDMRSSDWLLHEAQYLVRLASRAIWLEDDTQGAITLLRDADNRLTELNDPNLLPLREVIHQDIEQLSLLPALESESVILTLIGLENQIETLPLALAYTPDSAEQEPDFTLSENTEDWRENLSKSWQRLMEDFITVRRRTANVEALLSPSQQENLQQNLSLKLQVAQWAVTRKNSELFGQSIADIQAWLMSYYDMDSQQVIRFNERLAELNKAVIDLPLPTQLRSLKAISQTLEYQPNQTPKQVPLLEKLPMPKPVSTDKEDEGSA